MAVHSIHTDLAVRAPGETRRRPSALALAPLVGLAAGVVVGGIARGWMRLLADDPDFSWSGTIFIVLAFALTGLGHAAAWAVRRATSRRWLSTLARMAGGALTLPLFVGAGALMLPTLAAGSLARWRSDWRRGARLACSAIAAPVPIGLLVAWVRDGMEVVDALGLALLAATYAAIVTTTRSIVAPVDDGWRMPRGLKIVAVAVGVVLLAALVAGTVGLATGDR